MSKAKKILAIVVIVPLLALGGKYLLQKHDEGLLGAAMASTDDAMAQCKENMVIMHDEFQDIIDQCQERKNFYKKASEIMKEDEYTDCEAVLHFEKNGR